MSKQDVTPALADGGLPLRLLLCPASTDPLSVPGRLNRCGRSVGVRLLRESCDVLLKSLKLHILAASQWLLAECADEIALYVHWGIDVQDPPGSPACDAQHRELSPSPSLSRPGHSRIRAFLSHGGLNSIFEAMYHGVPVVGLPLFGDHYDTMTRVQAKGMGILLEWKVVTEDALHTALVKVIGDPR